MTIAMGLFANKAFAIAPGLGINAVLAFGLVAGAVLGFPEAMGIIVMEGVLVTALVLTGVREMVMAAIPLELKKAIAIGIGLFIAFIGLYNSGIIVRGAATPVELGRFTTWPILVALFGIVVTLSCGRSASVVISPGNPPTTSSPRSSTGRPTTPPTRPRLRMGALAVRLSETPNFSLVGEFSFDSFATLGVVSTLVWVFALFLADFFDTMGTLVGVGRPAGYLNEDGEFPDIRKPLLVDSVAAMAGGAASASSATTYIESGAGVAAGGRTGWVSVVTGALFFPFLFFAPLIGMVPPEATAAALVIVGWLMITTLTEVEEDDQEGGPSRSGRGGSSPHRLPRFRIGLSAALVIMIMPFTYSITNGIGFGFIAYALIRVAQGEAPRSPVHVRRVGRVRALLPRPAPAGHLRLDLETERIDRFGARGDDDALRLEIHVEH